MTFAFVVLPVAVAGGTMTAVADAGTGSTLVPLFAFQFDFKLAVAAIALPHLAVTTVRTIQLRKEIDCSLFMRFGIECAVASLIGALVQSRVSAPVISYVFTSTLALTKHLIINLSKPPALPGDS